MSKLIFKASKFLADNEENAEMYLTDIGTRTWVDWCDGRGVNMTNNYWGRVPGSRGYTHLVHIDWCEVIDNEQ